MKKLLLIVALLCACGGVPDTSNIDTHVLSVKTIDYFDGTPSVRIEVDRGFDRDAYVAAMLESEDDRGVDLGGDFGAVRQGLTIAGRYGIDSQAVPSSIETRCPNNPPYTGNASINPNGNYCQASANKLNKYWIEPSVAPWNARFGHDLGSIFIGVVADDNVGTSWNSQVTTIYSQALYQMDDDPTGVFCPGPGCTYNNLAPITLAQPTGARMRKYKADGGGWFGHITTNIQYMYDHNFLSDSSSQQFRNNVMINVYRHEVGHMMGLGHRPVSPGEVRNTMALNAGRGDAVFNLLSDQKSELTGYTP